MKFRSQLFYFANPSCLSVRLESGGSAHIKNVLKEMEAVANDLGINVFVNFNGIELGCSPGAHAGPVKPIDQAQIDEWLL